MDSKTQPFVNVVDIEQVCSQPTSGGRTLRRYARDLDVLEAIEQISGLLDNPALAASNASMRIPTALKDAAALAGSELGVELSATTLTSDALRATLEAVVMQAILDDHYVRYPDSRPDLGILRSQRPSSMAISWPRSRTGCAGRPLKSLMCIRALALKMCCCGPRHGHTLREPAGHS